MIVYDGERFCNAKEASRYLGIHRCMFYINVRRCVKAYKVGARRRLLYKLADLEPFRQVEQVA
jgi:hypothetical protein